MVNQETQGWKQERHLTGEPKQGKLEGIASTRVMSFMSEYRGKLTGLQSISQTCGHDDSGLGKANAEGEGFRMVGLDDTRAGFEGGRGVLDPKAGSTEARSYVSQELASVAPLSATGSQKSPGY